MHGFLEEGKGIVQEGASGSPFLPDEEWTSEFGRPRTTWGRLPSKPLCDLHNPPSDRWKLARAKDSEDVELGLDRSSIRFDGRSYHGRDGYGSVQEDEIQACASHLGSFAGSERKATRRRRVGVHLPFGREQQAWKRHGWKLRGQVPALVRGALLLQEGSGRAVRTRALDRLPRKRTAWASEGRPDEDAFGRRDRFEDGQGVDERILGAREVVSLLLFQRGASLHEPMVSRCTPGGHPRGARAFQEGEDARPRARCWSSEGARMDPGSDTRRKEEVRFELDRIFSSSCLSRRKDERRGSQIVEDASEEKTCLLGIRSFENRSKQRKRMPSASIHFRIERGRRMPTSRVRSERRDPIRRLVRRIYDETIGIGNERQVREVDARVVRRIRASFEP